MDIIVDPRAKGVCPMAKGFYLEDFDAVFIKNIKVRRIEFNLPGKILGKRLVIRQKQQIRHLFYP